MSAARDDDSNNDGRCEICDWKGPAEDVVMHGEFGLCPPHSAQAEREFRECNHRWVASVNEWGEPSHACDACSCEIADDEFEGILGTAPPPRPALQ